MKQRHGIAWLSAAIMVMLLGMAAPGRAAEDSEAARDAFARGIEAIDLGRFDTAIEPLREAVRLDSTESDERVFLSGVFSRPYLPHFYLGWALSRVGDQHCDDAVRHFDQSLAQGLVERFSRSHEQLRTAREHCLTILLPAAETRARQALDDVLSGVATVRRPADDPAVRELQDELASLRRTLASARAAGDLAAIRAAEDRARTLLADIEALVSNDRLASVPATDPDPPMVTSPSATSLEPDVVVRRDSEVRELPPARTPPVNGSSPAATEAVIERPAATPIHGADPALVQRLAGLVETVAGYLDDLPSPAVGVASEGGLLEVHQRRCRQLVARARALSDRATELQIRGLRQRLEASFAALRWLTGATALLAGEPREALDRLGNQPSALIDDGLIARHHLIESAARFAVFRLGGELDPSQRQRAVDAARACHRLTPELVPSSRLFSPAFRDFFAAATQNR